METDQTAFFSEDTVRLAWERAGGRCECRPNALHWKCHRMLAWERRGIFKPGGWEPDLHNPNGDGGGDVPDNCIIVCMSCYTVRHAPSQGEVLGRPVF